MLWLPLLFGKGWAVTLASMCLKLRLKQCNAVCIPAPRCWWYLGIRELPNIAASSVLQVLLTA